MRSDWGFVSLSHSHGSLLMAWSSAPVGVDLERLDRAFASEALMRRYYAASEQHQLRRPSQTSVSRQCFAALADQGSCD
jgi:phosphopantetheinyl transferase